MIQLIGWASAARTLLSGSSVVMAVVAAAAGVLFALKWQIEGRATAVAARACDQRVAAVIEVQDRKGEARAEDADEAADRVVRAGNRAALERVCKDDPACRDRQD